MSALTREQAKALIDRVLRVSKADAVQVNVNSGDERNVRFADNRITTSGTTNDLSVRVFSAFGKRGAVSSGNDVSDEGLEQIRRAMRLNPYPANWYFLLLGQAQFSTPACRDRRPAPFPCRPTIGPSDDRHTAGRHAQQRRRFAIVPRASDAVITEVDFSRTKQEIVNVA